MILKSGQTIPYSFQAQYSFQKTFALLVIFLLLYILSAVVPFLTRYMNSIAMQKKY